MHKTLPMKQILSLLLGLVLLCGMAAAEDAQTMATPAAAPLWMPTHINWGLGTDEFTQLTREYSDALYLLQETDEIQEYWLEGIPAEELPDLAWLDTAEVPAVPEAPAVDVIGAYYVFRFNTLACTGIEFGPGAPEVFQWLQDSITTLYGDPVETDPGQAVYMFNAYKESFPEDILGDVTGWRMQDGTHVYLMSVADMPYVFYVDKDNLYGNPPE